MSTFSASIKRYEQGLSATLGDGFVPADLQEKHARMAESLFAFFRATYWRFAETVFERAPELANAPEIAAVGDVHLENFGTWRDAEGRLVWGVNDFDDAARMPFALDLVRLAASAIIARSEDHADGRAIATALLAGYRKGLDAPAPFILDKDHQWLRKLVYLGEKSRRKFWEKFSELPVVQPPRRYFDALRLAAPEEDIDFAFLRRTAGLGSLGKLRVVGVTVWRGAPLIREGKAICPSGFVLRPGGAASAVPLLSVAAGRFRASDPWLRVHEGVLVRRLAPSSRKIEVDEDADSLIAPRMLRAMGFELANIHRAGLDDAAPLRRWLDRNEKNWLLAAARRVADGLDADYREFRAR